MDELELRRLQQRVALKCEIRVQQVANPQIDRTLLLGEHSHGSILHVWLAGGLICRGEFWNRTVKNLRIGGQPPVDTLVPQNWLFPESTDADFAGLLVDSGMHLGYGPFRPLSGEFRLMTHAPYHWLTAVFDGPDSKVIERSEARP